MEDVEIEVTVDTDEVIDKLDAGDIVDYIGREKILSCFTEKEVVAYFGANGLLDEIGKETCIEYFGE